MPPEAAASLPRKWEVLGDVLVLKLPAALEPWRQEVARAYGEVLGARAVVRDAAGVGGEFREFQTEILAGDTAETTHLENGIRYRLDASRIMFSSGNLDERIRVARMNVRGETLVDMFAGIGYFALPFAVHAGAARVVAIEKNPLAHRFLAENAKLNKVADVIEPWLGDNREYPERGFADRVHMGYFPKTDAFLPTAFEFLKPEGGWIHFHNTFYERTWREEIRRQFDGAAAAAGRTIVEATPREAKTFAPGVLHAVLDARLA